MDEVKVALSCIQENLIHIGISTTFEIGGNLMQEC